MEKIEEIRNIHNLIKNCKTTYLERRIPIELEDEAHDLLDEWLKSKGFDPNEI